ncbi:MAG: SDR family NAD(P)-dependent oxidoreductase, partial [Oscillospiraceae bacterium]|nr:SDR family NAD(P)-dependent oxidoreductase [Oscillospiraceae bacterium]
MKVLITGASSGIGRDMARYLSGKGFDLILTARNTQKLEALKKTLKTNVEIISSDLSEENAPFLLYKKCRSKNIDFLINNAGYGIFGEFDKTDILDELDMINVNIRAMHILTKLFLRDFKRRNYGMILNVASSAGFMTGPLMSSYYATKNYVLRLSMAIYEELRRSGSNVKISVFCPGPVDTNFNNRAGVSFSVKSISSEYAAKYAID